jgi:hypothetical protein
MSTGEQAISHLFTASPDEHVCSVCAAYRSKHGRPPAALLVESNLAKQLTPGRACVPVIPMIVTAIQYYKTMPDRSMVVAVDENFSFHQGL